MGTVVQVIRFTQLGGSMIVRCDECKTTPAELMFRLDPADDEFFFLCEPCMQQHAVRLPDLPEA